MLSYLAGGCAALALICGVEGWYIVRLHDKQIITSTALSQEVAAHKKDAKQCQDDAEDAQKSYTTLANNAMQAGRTIEKVVYGSTPQHCPSDRKLISTDELRSISGQATRTIIVPTISDGDATK